MFLSEHGLYKIQDGGDDYESTGECELYTWQTGQVYPFSRYTTHCLLFYPPTRFLTSLSIFFFGGPGRKLVVFLPVNNYQDHDFPVYFVQVWVLSIIFFWVTPILHKTWINASWSEQPNQPGNMGIRRYWFLPLWLRQCFLCCLKCFCDDATTIFVTPTNLPVLYLPYLARLIKGS